MNIDDALSKAVDGFRVRHDGLPEGAFICYNFDGWRIQFSHNGKLGSSCNYQPDDYPERDHVENWYVIDANKNPTCWPDFVQTNWDIDAAIDRVDPEDIEICPSYWTVDEEKVNQEEKIKKGWLKFDKEKN